MDTVIQPLWYCARTKPRHEHIAAADVRKSLGLEVFNPQLRFERATRNGILRVTEPLFPCYLFIRCALKQSLREIRYASGVGSVVHFAGHIPSIPDEVIAELQTSFGTTGTLDASDALRPGDEVLLADGAFAGMHASVLRVLPVRQRVQVLVELLGRPTSVEVDRGAVLAQKNTIADRVPSLAASCKPVAAPARCFRIDPIR